MTRKQDGNVDRRTRNFIIAALRRLSLKDPSRNRAKNKQKVDKALFACATKDCENLMYEGVSNKNMSELTKKYPNHNIIQGKIELDHRVPIGAFEDWNSYIPAMFCEESNYQGLCRDCHKEKTKKENKKRAAKRKK